MLRHLVNGGFRSLTQQLRHTYVIRYTPKRSAFDKTAYNEEWLPRQKLYNKHRKPRQPEWDDPELVYPKLIPPLYKPCSFKHYVRTVIEAEEKQKAERSKEYLLADIRPGDIVDITFQQTFESSQTVTHRCLVLSFKRKRTWTAALQVAIRFGGMSLKCIYLVHSPKVKKIELVGRGSGCFQANLKHEWQKLKKDALTTPKIRKRVMRPRGFGGKRRIGGAKDATATTVKTKGASVKYDKIQTDNVKKLV